MRTVLVVSLFLGASLAPAWAGEAARAGPAPEGLRVAVGDWCPPGETRPGHDCIVPPKLIQGITPDYPEIARRSRFTGKVEMEALVSEFGDVIAVEVLTPSPIFEESAVAAVKQRRYEPAYREGIPVAVRLAVTVRYGLEDSSEGPAPGTGGAELVNVGLAETRTHGSAKREDRTTEISAKSLR